MKGYGQFCPIAKASEIVAERWTPLVLRELICGSSHFNDIHRGVPLMSRGLLSRRLQQLADAGLVERRCDPGGQHTEYRLTPAGRELEPLLMALGEWGARWVRSNLEKQDLDASLLIWDMQRRVRPERFPAGRVVVAFEFLDTPRNRRFWWLVSEHDSVDVCAIDPGFEVDLRLRGSLQSLTAVWTGSSALADELAAGRLELLGPARLRRRFPEWLALSPFAHVRPAETRTANERE